MRLESDWGTCPHCGGPAVVTWLRSTAERAGIRHRSEVRMGIRCIDARCEGGGPRASD
jgi:hypothetical protein